ncbi:MAG TPA: mannose-6-phosphate isomerase, class I [Micromonosporaceae bacterium]
MHRLVGRIRPYSWGSRTEIARIQGRPVPSPTPEAEVWYGAHPRDPSFLLNDDGARRSLTAVIEADPATTLGRDVSGGYGPRLPFLLKLLAADRPLSLQVHPGPVHAREGFAAEEAAGVPPDAPHRNYVDPHHKPELLVAVTEFHALCGFRPLPDAVRLLRRLELPELKATLECLTLFQPDQALREAMASLFAVPARQRSALVARVREASLALIPEPEYRLAVELADRYPADIGVVVSFLLNRVTLLPGEAIYMPAGNLHAYLAGVGLEVMASSDNVLRGGLTGKHVDVPELLRVLRYEELPEPRLAPVPAADRVIWWPAPVTDFRLARATVAGRAVRLPLPGGPSPRIVLCLAGSVRVATAGDGLDLARGDAAFVPAGVAEVAVTGSGDVYQVSVG